jgi:hypothetical protein
MTVMIEIAIPPGEAQTPLQVKPNIPVTSRLPVRELTGSRTKRYELPLRRSDQFVADIEAAPVPDVATAHLHELQRQYCERFGATPPWVLAHTHAEQLQVIADAMRNDQELSGALLDVHTPSQPFELESLGEPSSPLAALQPEYAELVMPPP